MQIEEMVRPGAEPAVIIRDENIQRSKVVDMLLRLSSYQLTARDLISERVRAECDRRLLDKDGQSAVPLVQPTAEEAKLNAQVQRTREGRDPERQVARALRGFEENAFILLVADRQVEDLDAPVSIGPETVVTFLRLTPLVGG